MALGTTILHLVSAGPRPAKPLLGVVERGWNAGDEPARVLEIILPAGLDELFRELGALGDALDPDTMATLASRYGAQVDFERTFPTSSGMG
jgi:hypothetical protein